MDRSGSVFAGPVLSLCLLANASAAQDGRSGLAEDLVDCAAIEDGEARLACYDSLAEPLVGLSFDEPADGQEVLFTFSGTDDGDTEAFSTTGPWRAVWQSQTDILTIELRDTRDNLVGTIGFQIGSGGGRSDVQSPGRYKLAMRGSGGWRVSIVPVE